MIITRLGQGVDATGRLAPDALERTLDGDRAVLPAGAGARTSSGSASARRARCGTPRTADGFERAGARARRVRARGRSAGTRRRGSRSSARPGAWTRPAPFLVLDIGGGSTEFVMGRRARTAAISTQMGSVRLTERFVRGDPPAAEDLGGCERRSASCWTMSSARPGRRCADVRRGGRDATTMQAIALGLGRYDPERIHRTWLSRGRGRAGVLASWPA